MPRCIHDARVFNEQIFEQGYILKAANGNRLALIVAITGKSNFIGSLLAQIHLSEGNSELSSWFFASKIRGMKSAPSVFMQPRHRPVFHHSFMTSALLSMKCA